jgi:hypothetical protein
MRTTNHAIPLIWALFPRPLRRFQRILSPVRHQTNTKVKMQTHLSFLESGIPEVRHWAASSSRAGESDPSKNSKAIRSVASLLLSIIM